MTQRPRRPRYTGKDQNHHIVTDFMKWGCGGFTEAPKELRGDTLAYTANYRGRKFLAIDMANYGGILVDWQVICVDRGTVWFIEVKTPEAFAAKNNSTTPGEEWLIDNTRGLVEVAVTVEDVQGIFEGML